MLCYSTFCLKSSGTWELIKNAQSLTPTPNRSISIYISTSSGVMHLRSPGIPNKSVHCGARLAEFKWPFQMGNLGKLLIFLCSVLSENGENNSTKEGQCEDCRSFSCNTLRLDLEQNRCIKVFAITVVNPVQIVSICSFILVRIKEEMEQKQFGGWSEVEMIVKESSSLPALRLELT